MDHDEDLEQLMLAQSPRFAALLDRSRRCVKAGKALSEREFWSAVRRRVQKRKGEKWARR